MRINEIFKTKKSLLAFEVFPPRPDVPSETINDSLRQLSELKPDYMSVTYGAGGNSRGKTIEISAKIKKDYNIESMAHFTCAGHTTNDIDTMLTMMKQNDLENILALRGDPPLDQPDFIFEKNAYCYAGDLIEHIKKNDNFCIAAAAYPEGHIDCKRIKDDITNLKKKVEMGVDFLITQLFFDNRLYYDLIEKLAAMNIGCPVAAGIMPVFKAEQIKGITAKSGCSIPAKLVILMDKYSNNPADMLKAGIEYAGMQIRDLISNGADGIHLFTMNRPKSTRKILVEAGLI